jgi:hypothetical protein
MLFVGLSLGYFNLDGYLQYKTVVDADPMVYRLEPSICYCTFP